MSVLSPAREVSFRILHKVEQGGYASDLLRRECAGLSARDAALAESIVFGCLRRQAQLDFLIEHFSGRRGVKLDLEVRIALRMGIFQIRFLDRIPQHAAASESVELVKKARKRSAAGFVNAVLRKANREPITWPDEATELNLPAWMLDRWRSQYGADIAAGIARAALEEPESYTNPETGRQQDIGAQSVVPWLEVKAGMKVLDLCAAPGNKTAQLLVSGGEVVAGDRYLQRLMEVPEQAQRVVLDATQALPFSHSFDRILLDAPCSGTGTLARNPEIKWRLKPGDLAEFQNRQREILQNALTCLRAGGKMVYATCSLETEENEDVVRKIAQLNPNARVVSQNVRLPGVEPGDGFFAAVITL